MTTLTEIAQTLTALFTDRAYKQIALDHAQAALDLRRLTLTPADGWPGKNEAQRDAARDNALYADDGYREMGEAVAKLRDELTHIQATIDGMQETASAERWRIREMLAVNLQTRTHGEHCEDAAKAAPQFDAAAQAAMDDGEDIPF